VKLQYVMSLIFLVGCASHSDAMTRLDYNEVTLGTPIDEVTRRLGEPYAIHDRGHGIEEYEYIERVSMNNELVYENHYFLRVVNGQVVEKRTKEETRPPYDQLWQTDPNYPSYP